MGITLLTMILFSLGAYFFVYFFYEKNRIGFVNKDSKFAYGFIFMIVGIPVGVFISEYVRVLVENESFGKNQVEIIEKHKLDPFAGGVYVAIEESKFNKKAWFLQSGELKELLLLDHNKHSLVASVVFSNDSFATVQVVRPSTSFFWKCLIFRPKSRLFIVPQGSIKKGRVKGTYEVVPCP